MASKEELKQEKLEAKRIKERDKNAEKELKNLDKRISKCTTRDIRLNAKQILHIDSFLPARAVANDPVDKLNQLIKEIKTEYKKTREDQLPALIYEAIRYKRKEFYREAEDKIRFCISVGDLISTYKRCLEGFGFKESTLNTIYQKQLSKVLKEDIKKLKTIIDKKLECNIHGEVNRVEVLDDLEREWSRLSNDDLDMPNEVKIYLKLKTKELEKKYAKEQEHFKATTAENYIKNAKTYDEIMQRRQTILKDTDYETYIWTDACKEIFAKKKQQLYKEKVKNDKIQYKQAIERINSARTISSLEDFPLDKYATNINYEKIKTVLQQKMDSLTKIERKETIKQIQSVKNNKNKVEEQEIVKTPLTEEEIAIYEDKIEIADNKELREMEKALENRQNASKLLDKIIHKRVDNNEKSRRRDTYARLDAKRRELKEERDRIQDQIDHPIKDRKQLHSQIHIYLSTSELKELDKHLKFINSQINDIERQISDIG